MSGDIVLANIERAGYRDTPIISNVNLEIQAGESVLIRGSSGSGKTTLIFALTGVLKHLLGGFVEGRVEIAGLNTLEFIDFRRLHTVIGVLLQDPEKQLVMPTPFDEIVAFLEVLGYTYEEASRKGLELLRDLGLGGRENKHVENLSTGEKRRLAIALTFIHEPKVVFLDEPSANLDPSGIRAVKDLVKSHVKKGGGVLITDHRPGYFVDIADNILVMEKGKLIKYEFYEPSTGEVVCSENELEVGDKVVETKDLDVGYGDQRVVENIDLELRRGEILALIGPNGSGKTTILKTLAGWIKPLKGEVNIRAHKIFYSPQTPDLVFLYSSVEKELAETSRRTGISFDELVEKIPWYPSIKKLSPYRLSHGQRRWLSLIIGVSYGRDLLLLDEPSTGLDPVLYTSLVKMLNHVAKRGGAIMLSTHDPRIVGELATRVLLVENGRLREVDKCAAVRSMVDVGV